MENNLEQPISQQPPIQQSVNEIPKPRSKFKLILLIIIILIIVGTGVYYFGTKQNNTIVQKQITPTPTQSIPTPTPDPTANWKTYTNINNSYSFKYPDTIFSIQEIGSKTRLLKGMGYAFEVNVIQATDTAENWLIKEKNNDQFPDNNWKTIQSTFQSHPALLLQSLPNTMQVAMDVFVVKNNNMIYEISFSKEASDKIIVDQILSTFKLTDQTVQIIPVSTIEPIANWKTYVNGEFGFEFKYPSNLNNLINNKNPSIFEDFNVFSETKNGSDNPYKGKSCSATCGLFSKDTGLYLKQFDLLNQMQNFQSCNLNQDYINSFKKDFIMFFSGIPKTLEVQGIKLEKQCAVKYMAMDGYVLGLNILYYRVAYIKDNKAVNISLPLFPVGAFSQVDKLYSSFGYTDNSCDSSCSDKESDYINKITAGGNLIKDNVVESVTQVYDQIFSTFKFTE